MKRTLILIALLFIILTPLAYAWPPVTGDCVENCEFTGPASFTDLDVSGTFTQATDQANYSFMGQMQTVLSKCVLAFGWFNTGNGNTEVNQCGKGLSDTTQYNAVYSADADWDSARTTLASGYVIDFDGVDDSITITDAASNLDFTPCADLDNDGSCDDAGLAIGDSSSADVDHDAFSYEINGVVFTVAATGASELTLTGANCPTDKTCAWGFDIDATGTVTVVAASDNATGYADDNFAGQGVAAPTAGKIRFGMLAIANTSGSPFQPGTTGLDAAGIAETFYNNLLSSYTWAFWVNSDDVAPGDVIFGKWDGNTGTATEWLFEIWVGPNIRFRMGDSNQGGVSIVTSIDETLSADTWYFFALTLNPSSNTRGNSIKVYVNGIEDTATIGNNGAFGAIAETATNLQFGDITDNPNTLFDGLLGAVLVTKSTLTEGQIAALYNISRAHYGQ